MLVVDSRKPSVARNTNGCRLSPDRVVTRFTDAAVGGRRGIRSRSEKYSRKTGGTSVSKTLSSTNPDSIATSGPPCGPGLGGGEVFIVLCLPFAGFGITRRFDILLTETIHRTGMAFFRNNRAELRMKASSEPTWMSAAMMGASRPKKASTMPAMSTRIVPQKLNMMTR